MADDGAASWSYANDAKILMGFAAVALVFLGIDAAIVASGPTDPEIVSLADVVFAAAVFILLFGVFLFLPRMLGRGHISYSLHVERSLDDAQALVTSAIERSGRTAKVEFRESRFTRPPRTVRVAGVDTRFVLKAAQDRERPGAGSSWTEIVQAGVRDPADGTARELREQVAAALNGTGLEA